MKCVILEDNINHQSYLEKKLLEINPHFTIQKYNDYSSFKKDFMFFEDGSLFFMDIVINDDNGIDITKKINQKYKKSLIIYITGYLEYARDISDSEYCYFIYKPDLDVKLPKAIKKAVRRLQSLKQQIIVNYKGNTSIIDSEQIFYFERNLRKTMICLNDTTFETYDNFDCLLNQLMNDFHICHRSFIVNFRKVKEYHRQYFILKNNVRIPISRSYEKEIKKLFEEYLLLQ